MRDEFDLKGLRALYGYWNEHPPVHELVGAYMGVKSKKPKTKTSSSLRDLVSELGASGFNGYKKPRAR